MIDWLVALPLIVRSLEIVEPAVLDVISSRFKSTPESEKAKLRKMLESLRNEVSRLTNEPNRKNRSEIVEKISEIQNKVDSDEYQEALRPDVADVILGSLQAAKEEKKATALEILQDLRKLLNTWIHDLRFSGSLPEEQE